MKVAIITPSMDPMSGWGRYSTSVIDALKRKEMDPIVITTEYLSQSPISFIRNLLKVKRKSRRADVVHALDGWPFAVYGYFAVLGTRKKLFISGVGTYSVAPFGNLLKGLLLRAAYLKANLIFCISNYTKEAIRRKVKKVRVETVYMGSPILPTLTLLEINEYEERYALEGHTPIVLTVGEVKHRKGQLDTLKAINLLKDEYPKILYVMVGSHDKRYVNAIEKYASDNGIEKNIKFINDALDDKSLSFFYNACDIFALNSNNDGSHFEGFGLVLLEAAQFGKPVIGSRNCGIEDSIWDGYNGYLTDQGNEKDICDKIKVLLKRNKEELSENSINFSKKFSWDKTVDDYINYYKNK